MGIRHTKRFAVAVATAAIATSASVPTGAASPGGAPTRATVTRFTLVTGEQILQRTDAAGRESVEVAGAGGSPLLTYRLGSASYVVPAAAVPFLSGGLDPALFDTARLRGTEIAGQVPVLVRWHGRSRPPMPWLVSPHAVGWGVTSGRVTSSSGKALERDLAAQPRASRIGWSGSLQGIDRIALDGGAANPPPAPRFTMYTLTVNGIDASGAPDTGDSAFMLNVDNAAKFIAGAFWYHGVLKLSVPSGHYSAAGTFFAFSPTSASLRLTVLDFIVRGDTTVTIDARASTSPVSVSTPRAAPSGFGTVQWQRTAVSGGGVGAGLGWSIGPSGPPTSVYVNPTPAPAVGGQSWLASFHLDSSAQGSGSYTYDLAFEAVGAIPSNQHYVVAPSQLAAVDTRYFSDVGGRATGEARPAFFPGQFFSFGSFDVFAAPLQRTEYVTALPVLVWFQQVVQSLTSFAGFFFDSGNVFNAGEATTADWSRGPAGPGVAAPGGGATFSQVCPACTEAGTLEFAIDPFGDNPPGHSGPPNIGAPGVSETDAFDLLRNGASIASGQDPLGVVVPVPPGPATYQLGYAVTMSAPWWTLSTSVTTQWTFRSPASTQGVPPPGWACFSGSATGCNVIGLMVPDYRIREDLTNHVATGATSFQLNIQHILDVAIAATRATVSVSFDGGLVWSAAHVTSNPAGGFTVSYTNPPGASTASLRIHVADADGGLLDQTIINAYAIS
jgi:hypothetical protein